MSVDPATDAPELSIFVVSYNTRELTRGCLESVFRTMERTPFEVIVVDNASTDGSAEMVARDFERVRVVPNEVNLGFAAANNLAASEARGSWFLLLNPDTVALEGSIERLLAFAKSHPQAGVVGGRTLSADGSLNPWSCRGRPTPWALFCRAVGLSALFRGNRFFDPSSLGGWQRDSVREVDVVVGCFFLVPQSLWCRLEGFDPTFFMYGEETDFCLRARALGYRPMITPDAEIIHFEGASEPIQADKLVRLLAAHSTLVRKHWSGPAALFGISMLWLWARSRALAGRLLPHLGASFASSKLAAWSEVWLRREEWLPGFDRPAQSASQGGSRGHG